MADGGIGEMALMDFLMPAVTSAGIKGVTNLIGGKDPFDNVLESGLMGGLTGGILKGIMPGAATTTAPAVSPGAVPTTTFGDVNMEAFAPTSTQYGAFGEAPSPIGSTMGSGASYDGSSYTGQMPGGTPSVSDAVQSAALRAELSKTLPPPGASQMAGAQNTSGDGSNPVSQWWNSLSNKQKLLTGGAGALGIGMLADRNKYGMPAQTPYTGALSRFTYDPKTYRPGIYAEGGITSLNSGSNMVVGGNPIGATNAIERTNWQSNSFPAQFMASGGISSLGGYSDGGRMLKGPGDGMSDSIPASIAGRRPARLATEEFVVPADVVSHLGNGSSDAGAKQLYAMMDKVRQARTGRKSQGRQINPQKYMPA